MIERGRDAAHQRVAMLAVGRDDRVVGLQRLHRADGDRLLADVEMQEAADLGGAVQLGAFLFEAADAHHLAQELERDARRVGSTQRL